MKKIAAIFIFILICVFTIKLTCLIFAGEVCPLCYNMVWGVVWSGDSPVKGIPVLYQDSRTTDTLQMATNDKGIYSFNFYKDCSGYATVSLASGGCMTSKSATVYLTKFKAVRHDFDLAGMGSTVNKSARQQRLSSQGLPIVYVTDTGYMYHSYGCQYLQDSCRPIPLEYILSITTYEKCTVCNP